MKIVIDATAAISGGRLYLEKLLPELAEIGSRHEFLVFHTGDLNQLAARISNQRFGFYRVAIPLLRDGQWAGASILRMLWRKFFLPGHLRRIEPDLLFSNSGAVPRSKPVKTKTVIALHNCMPLREELVAEERSAVRRWRLKLLRRQMQRSLQTCDGSIVFSEDTQLRIQGNFGALPHTPSVVHHAIDWGEPERQMAVSFDGLSLLGVAQPYLLYVSQFHRYKNVLRLLEAFAPLAVHHPRLSLVLAGGIADRDYWNEIEKTIERLNLKRQVIHVPACPREQLIALYRGALAFVQPSLAETCSFPLLEALALGVPTAAARMSALPEMAGDAAIYFDPYNVNEMSQVMDRLVWDEQVRGQLSGRATDQAGQFTWEKTAQGTLEVFERIGHS